MVCMSWFYENCQICCRYSDHSGMHSKPTYYSGAIGVQDIFGFDVFRFVVFYDSFANIIGFGTCRDN